jgi:hypothetical protein
MNPGSEKYSPTAKARRIICWSRPQSEYRCCTIINHKVSTTKQVDENAG